MRKPNESCGTERWEYLKLLRPEPRMVHCSAYASMKPNPLDLLGTLGLPRIPWVEKPGVTLLRKKPAHRGLHSTETLEPRLPE
jgi:hypothetical protein